MAKALNLYKWYFHSAKKNETLKSIQASVDHLMLVFVGKPGCSVCKAQWKALNTPEFTKYLKENEIVGLKIDDTQAHYQSLLAQAKRYMNPDGSKTENGAPFLALVKNNAVLTDLELSMTFKKTGVPHILEWICGSTSKYVPITDDKNVITWIEEIKQTDIFKKAFPWLVPPRVLKFVKASPPEAEEADELQECPEKYLVAGGGSIIQDSIKIKTSEDVKIKYSELCDCDEIYAVTVGDQEFQVSYRYWKGMKEPQVWILGDDDADTKLICTTEKLPKAGKEKILKALFISYMLGSGYLKLEQ